MELTTLTTDGLMELTTLSTTLTRIALTADGLMELNYRSTDGVDLQMNSWS